MLVEGTPAPEFSLLDQTGEEHTLSQYKGKWILIYFYPKDNTPGCTAEACSIRDSWSEFSQAGLSVLGISADSVESHQKFAEKHELPFTLLADPTSEAISAYKAGTKGAKRVSYLIDPTGIIKKVYPKVKPNQHAQEVLADWKDLQSEL